MINIRTFATILAIAFFASCSSERDQAASSEVVDPPKTTTARDEVPGTVVQSALERLESGQSINWKDKTTGTVGTITPTRTFQIQKGSYCRDYAILFSGSDGGGYVMWHETACRNRSGVWQKIDSTSV